MAEWANLQLEGVTPPHPPSTETLGGIQISWGESIGGIFSGGKEWENLQLVVGHLIILPSVGKSLIYIMCSSYA